MKWQHWGVVVIGGWLILAPWILGYASVNLALWNSIAAGALLIVFTAWVITPPGNS